MGLLPRWMACLAAGRRPAQAVAPPVHEKSSSGGRSPAVAPANLRRHPAGAPCVGLASHDTSAAAAVHDRLLSQLSKVNSNPVLALLEAAESIASALQLDAVGIWVAPDGPDGPAVLMAAAGPRRSALQHGTVLRGRSTGSATRRSLGGSCSGNSSHAALASDVSSSLCRLGSASSSEADCPGAGCAAPCQTPRSAGPCSHGLHSAQREDAAERQQTLGARLQELACSAGLGGVTLAPIGPPDGEPLGALLLAPAEPGAPLEPPARAAAAALAQHTRQVAEAARMVAEVEAAGDPVAAVSLLLQAASSYLLRTCNMACCAPRLALLEPGAGDALVFESAPQLEPASPLAVQGSGGKLGSGALRAHSGAAGAVVVSEQPLDGTLLASAVRLSSVRFVRDTASYLQNSRTPAHDIFGDGGSASVASVMVVPLFVGGAARGGVYFSYSQPCEWGNIQDALLGFAHCACLMLVASPCLCTSKLRGLLRAEVGQQTGPPQAGGLPQTPDVVALPPVAASPGSLRLLEPSAAHAGRQSPQLLLGRGPSSCGGSSCGGARRGFSTEPLVSALQQAIGRARRRSCDLHTVDSLTAGEPLGRGGYSQVLRGTWHGRPAALKVLDPRRSDSKAVSDAMEMAVLTSVQHPSIVAVYACLADMVCVPGAPGQPTTYRALANGSADGRETFSIIVMEYCDRGTLGAAVKREGLFHGPGPGGLLRPDLPALVDVLVEIAASLQYMHSLRLLHGDVKLDNVLLKSDPQRALGVAPKLADFGLTKILGDTAVVNLTGAGTVTHLAPQMYVPGSQITTAVDVYAFGILVYEAYTAKNAYTGLSRQAIISAVSRHGARPEFPPGAPPALAQLAAACWAEAPEARPCFDQILAALRGLADQLGHADAECSLHTATRQPCALAGGEFRSTPVRCP